MDSIQEEMNNVSREMETSRKNQKERLEIKTAVPEMKKAFDGLISRFNMAGEMQIRSCTSQLEIS